MSRHHPPLIPAGPLSRQSAEALNRAMMDLYRLHGGFTAAPPLSCREDANGVSLRIDLPPPTFGVMQGPPYGSSSLGGSGSTNLCPFGFEEVVWDGSEWVVLEGGLSGIAYEFNGNCEVPVGTVVVIYQVNSNPITYIFEYCCEFQPISFGSGSYSGGIPGAPPEPPGVQPIQVSCCPLGVPSVLFAYIEPQFPNDPTLNCNNCLGFWMTLTWTVVPGSLGSWTGTGVTKCGDAISLDLTCDIGGSSCCAFTLTAYYDPTNTPWQVDGDVLGGHPINCPGAVAIQGDNCECPGSTVNNILLLYYWAVVPLGAGCTNSTAVIITITD